MWTTTFKRRHGQVVEMTHRFGNQVKVVTNFTELTIRRYHGGVCVKEYTADPNVEHYVQFLNNVAEEVGGGK